MRSLYSIPVSAGIAVFFLSASDQCDLLSVESDAKAKLLSRHRIFGIGKHTDVLLVAGCTARDGAPVSVLLREESGAEAQSEAILRLAPWNESTTAKVARLISSELLPHLNVTDHSPFIRFLSLSAAWREPCQTERADDDRILALVTTQPKRLGEEIAFFSVEEGRVRFERAVACSAGGRKAMVCLAASCGDVIYASVGADLVEFDISERRGGLTEIFQNLSSSQATRLLRWLVTLGPSFEQICRALESAAASPLPIQLPGLKVSKCIRTSDAVYVFVECSPQVVITQLTVRPLFGQSVPVKTQESQKRAGKEADIRNMVAVARVATTERLIELSIIADGIEHARWVAPTEPEQDLEAPALNLDSSRKVRLNMTKRVSL